MLVQPEGIDAFSWSCSSCRWLVLPLFAKALKGDQPGMRRCSSIYAPDPQKTLRLNGVAAICPWLGRAAAAILLKISVVWSSRPLL